jgi:hypothetical protein
MTRIAAFLSGFYLLFTASSGVAAPEKLTIVLPAPPSASRIVASKLYLKLGAGDDWHTPVLKNGQLTLRRAALPKAAAPVRWRDDKDRLPDGVLTLGNRDIAAAWLSQPTARYGHGVLGDAIEAGALSVLMKDGRLLTHALSPEAVFEDRLARLADLTGDGRDEVIVVKSYLDAGAAVAVYKPTADTLTPLAEAQPVGLPNRWLNPVGIADFDGDGKAEVAAVITPHIGGRLTLFGLHNGRLVAELQTSAFSNHAIGSRELGLATFGEFLGDGRIVIALPDAGREAMRLVTFAGGHFADLATIRHDRDITGPVVAQDLDGDDRPELVYPLDDGRLIALRF